MASAYGMAWMDKTIHTAEYRILLDLLRQARRKAGITQIDLASRIKETQSQVSKYERGELRLDVIELRSICLALGSTLPAFVAKLERCLSRRDKDEEK
jgi:transcriptional regulator with XRE-family HTH domain